MLILGSDILANRYIADPAFANNSWATIDAVCKANAIPQTWLEGTKQFVGTDGNTYTLRLSDKQTGRYKFEDGSDTHAVFELIELIPTSYKMNANNTNAGGFGASEMLTTLNNTVINILSAEIKDLLKTTTIKSDNGGGSNYSAIVDVNCKLFLPAALEVGFSTEYGREGEGTKWDYYTNHTADADRSKAKVTTPASYTYWWLRSSYPSIANYFDVVYNNGSGNTNSASSPNGVAFCFAL